MGGRASFTKREWLTLWAIGSVHFASAICISLQAPFYPQEAELKGATASEYGLVFGVFELVAFISSPIFGKYIDRIGVKYALNIGIIVAGVSSMMFGLLDLVPSHSGFIILSFLVRIAESLGAAAAVTASFCITAVVFPDSVATTFATLEVFYGLGYIIGPTIGGYLYQVGGFICPFTVMGALLFVDGVFIFFALPPIETDNRDKKQGQVVKVWKLPPVFLDSCSVCVAAMCVGYYTATLEPHIREFELSPVQTGAMFVITGGCYAITAPLVGKLCDTRVYPKKMIIFGSVLLIVSFLLVGPIPFVPIKINLWMCCLGLFIEGLGNACILVPAFIDIIRSAVAHGLPDDITTYGIVSGIWASSFALGAFIGPSVAGFLFDMVGFRNGTLVQIFLITILIFAMTLYVCVERRPPRKVEPEEIIHLAASSRSHSSSEDLEGSCSTDFRPKVNGYGAITTEVDAIRCNA